MARYKKVDRGDIALDMHEQQKILTREREVSNRGDSEVTELECRLEALAVQYAMLECAELRLMALDDFYLFTTVVLGYDLVKSDDGVRNPSKLVCDWLGVSSNDPVMVLLTRDTFKSTICTVAYPLWRLCKEPDFRWLLMMETHSKACDKLREIKGHIDGSNARSRFREVIGDWLPKKRNLRWSENEVDFTIRKLGYAEASITAMGVDGSPTGKHFDGHVLDDPCSDKTSQSKEQMQAVIRKAGALWGTLSSTGGKVIYVGTRWDDGDLYGFVLDNQCEGVEVPWVGGWSYDIAARGFIKNIV